MGVDTPGSSNFQYDGWVTCLAVSMVLRPRLDGTFKVFLGGLQRWKRMMANSPRYSCVNFSVNLSVNLSDGHFMSVFSCFFYSPVANSAGILAIQKLPWMFQVNLPRHEPRHLGRLMIVNLLDDLTSRLWIIPGLLEWIWMNYIYWILGANFDADPYPASISIYHKVYNLLTTEHAWQCTYIWHLGFQLLRFSTPRYFLCEFSHMIYCSNQHHSTTPLYRVTAGCPLPLWELRHASLMLLRCSATIEAKDDTERGKPYGWWFFEIPSNHLGCIKPGKTMGHLPVYHINWRYVYILYIYRMTYLYRTDLTTSTGEATMFLVVRRRKASSWWVDGLRNGWEVYRNPKEGVLGVTSLSETPTVSEAELASMLAVNNS